MSWLSGYKYRKLAPALGTVLGAQANYQMPLRTFYHDRVLSESAWGYCWNTLSNPAAYHFSGVHNRTYIVYQGPPTTSAAGDYYMMYYDEDTHIFSAPVWIAASPGGLATYYDSLPTIVIDDTGRIIIAYGSWNDTPVNIIRSTNPEDITSWGAAIQLKVGVGQCNWYPSFVKIANGDIYLFEQANAGDECRTYYYWKSTDDGVTWGAAVQLFNFTDIGDHKDQLCGYFSYDAVNDDIICELTQFMTAGIGSWQSQWFIRFNPVDSKIYDQAGGYASVVALSHANADNAANKFLIWYDALNCTYNGHVGVDNAGVPHIIFVKSVGGKLGTYTYQYTTWTGAAWAALTPIVQGWWGSSATTVITNANDITAYLAPGDGLYNSSYFSKYHYDGAAWSLVENIATPLAAGLQIQAISKPVDYVADLQILYVLADYTTFNNLIIQAYDGTQMMRYNAPGYMSLQTHSQTDFDDVRFTKADGSTALDYFRESYVASRQALFWIELDTIPASPASINIYTYYGNAGVATNSSIVNTFPFADHFDDASIDLAKWFHWLDNGSEVEAGSEFAVTGGVGLYNAWGAKTKFGTSFAFRGRIKVNVEAGNDICIMAFDDRSSDGLPIGVGADNGVIGFGIGGKVFINSREGVPTSVARVEPLTSYQVAEIRRNAGVNVKYLLYDVLKATIIANVPTDNCGFLIYSNDAGTTVTWDWVAVRNYVVTEPTWGPLGDEELFSSGGGAASKLISNKLL